MPIHLQIQTAYNLESAILLLFHPEMVAESSKMGGKLPLTLYEGLWVNEKESGGMEVDGGERNQSLKFREVPYSVETGEAEMISLDFVARGGGNASAIDATARKSQAVGDQKGKETENEKESRPQTNGTTTKESSYLSSEDEDLISSLTAKSNAIKMLQSRLNLISAYLQSLPPSYLTDSTIPLDPNTSTTELNHPILRSISALLSRLPLLAPPDTAAFETESLQGRSDVELVSLLGSLTRTVRETRELSKKWSAVESGRNAARRGRGGGDGEMEGPEEHEQGNGRGGLASLMSSF
jgi:COP9 signalosome complex subunit 6